MATASIRFTESFEDQIDDLLMRICIELQLDPTRRGVAVTSYQSVGECLESYPHVALLRPTIYPQGSMALDTTVKPLVGDEFDLDFVCQFFYPAHYFANPIDALDLVEAALRASLVYGPMVERKNRCIRLNYAHKFHMDILPACKDPKNGGTCVLVPDRQLKDWTASNPKGFTSWFDERCRQRAITRMMDKAAPIPNHQEAERKPLLKLGVQLLKRWRDLRYKANPELGPISIVLTTLAAQHYRGEESIALAVDHILSGISDQIRSSFPRLVVLNPKNTDEDLSERWNTKPGAYREFVSGITELDTQWKAILQARGIDKVARSLERLFGEEIAKKAVEKQARDIEAARERRDVGMKKGSGIITALSGGSVVPIPRHTFYGQED